jgi:hypothetical protein
VNGRAGLRHSVLRGLFPPPLGEVPSDKGSEIETKFPTDMDSISEPSYRGGGGYQASCEQR